MDFRSQLGCRNCTKPSKNQETNALKKDLSREALFFSPGQTQDIKFNETGDYDFFCGHHHAAGMMGKIHVR